MPGEQQPSDSGALGYDPTDLAVAINLAHGAAIDARTAISTVRDQLLNAIAYDVGKAQGATAKAARFASEKVAKSAGKAQAAIDGALADISQAIQGDIQRAVVPLVELDIPLPSQREITIEKQRLLGVPQPISLPEGSCTIRPHLLPEEIRTGYTALVWTSVNRYCVMPPAIFASLLQQQVKSMAPAIREVWTFTKWWRAELACLLLMECRWSENLLRTHIDDIDAMPIYSGSGGGQPVGLCAGAQMIWPDAPNLPGT